MLYLRLTKPLQHLSVIFTADLPLIIKTFKTNRRLILPAGSGTAPLAGNLRNNRNNKTQGATTT